MTLWQTSLTYQIWVWLCDVYEDSTLHRFLAAAGRWCSGQVEESRILRPLCREGIAARSWRDSFLCRVLSALVNLPGTLLHAWYKAWNLTFEDSFFARLAFDMGDSASIAQFWCIAALWCIPYERWNNAYSFMTGVLLLLLFYAGAMRTGRRLDVARIGFYPALMLAAVTLAVTFSYAPGLSARFLIYHVSAALLVVITVSAVRNGEDLKRLCAGAAVCVGATGAYGIVQRIQGVKVFSNYFHVDPVLTKDYLKTTAPMLVTNGLWGVNTALQTVILGHMTAAAIAANSVASTLYMLIKSTAVGASSTASVMIGKAVGSGDIPLTKHYSKLLQRLFLCIGVLSGITLFFIRIPILSIYDLQPATKEMANTFLIILSVICVGMTYQMPTNNGIIRGGGNALFVVKMDLISIWCIVLPLSFFMAFVMHASPTVVVWCLNADQIFKCVPAFLESNYGNWIRKLTRDE